MSPYPRQFPPRLTLKINWAISISLYCVNLGGCMGETKRETKYLGVRTLKVKIRISNK